MRCSNLHWNSFWEFHVLASLHGSPFGLVCVESFQNDPLRNLAENAIK